MTSGEAFEDIYYTSRDGLRLHARRYAATGGTRRHARPGLCLPGLTRNGRDFHDLAVALSTRSNTPRTVYTLDYRGRGLSDFDPDWRNYSVPLEMLDVIDFITLRGLQDAALIGTSRGGLITMLLAAAQPTTVGAVVLNDIGPVVEHEGLARISGYVGRVPLPISWADAGRIVRELNRRHFPEVSEGVWEEVARQWYNEKNGKPAPGYDSEPRQCSVGARRTAAGTMAPVRSAKACAADGRARRVLGHSNRQDGRRDAAAASGHGDDHCRESRPRAAAEGPNDNRGHPPLPYGGRCGSTVRDARLGLNYGAGSRASERPVTQFTSSPNHSFTTKSRRRSPSTGDAKKIHASAGPAVR